MRLLLALCCAAAALAPVHAQNTAVRGIVIDANTFAPLQGAQFALTVGRDTIGSARTDSAGKFRILLTNGPPGPAVLHGRRIGYHPDSIRVNTAADPILRLALMPAAIASLPSVLIRDSALTAFEKRARRNAGGTFMRIADIERLAPLRTADLFRRTPGVSFDDSAGVLRVFSQRSLRQTLRTGRGTTASADSARVPTSSGGLCSVRVGVDGQLMADGYSVNDIRPSDIAAIEMYVGAATIPIEFSSVQRNAPCGLIMIWTRRGRDR